MIDKNYMMEPENLEHEVLDRLNLLCEEDFNKNTLDDSYIDAMLKARDIILYLYERQNDRMTYLEDLLDTLNTYYSITVEDLENCIKNDK